MLSPEEERIFRPYKVLDELEQDNRHIALTFGGSVAAVGAGVAVIELVADEEWFSDNTVEYGPHLAMGGGILLTAAGVIGVATTVAARAYNAFAARRERRG